MKNISTTSHFQSTLTQVTSLAIFAAFVLPSHAAIQVVDFDDNISVTTSHAGTDTISLFEPATNLGTIQVSGDDTPVFGVTVNQGRGFSQGQDLGDSLIPVSAEIYSSAGIQELGLSGVINYMRFDLDGNNIFETVIEFDFGLASLLSDDRIIRYAYDDTGASLDVSNAVTELNAVPEPSSLILLALGVTPLLRKRR